MQKNELEVVNIRLVKEPSLYSEKPLHSPEDVKELVAKELAYYDREVMCVLNMKTNGQVINMNIVSVGSIRSALVSPREVFKSAILANAANVILVHNHPSGSVEPSREDILLTKRLEDCGNLLDIPVLDHVIVGGTTGEMFSFKSNDQMNEKWRSGKLQGETRAFLHENLLQKRLNGGQRKMFEKKEFAIALMDALDRIMPEEIELREETVKKVNQTQKGILAISDPGIGVVIYLDDFYSNYLQGKEIDVLAREAQKVIVDSLDMHKKDRMKMQGERINNYEEIKEDIFPMVINYQKNQSYLKEIPHERVLNLAVIPVVKVSEEAEIKVTNKLMKHWGKTTQELISQAKNNSAEKNPVSVFTMESLLGMPRDPENPRMYIVTNKERKYGATSIMNSEAFEQLRREMGDLYILPSSVHELIVISAEKADPVELEAMVQMINQNEVEEAERLSDHIYRYDGKEIQMLVHGKEVTPEVAEQNKKLVIHKSI